MEAKKFSVYFSGLAMAPQAPIIEIPSNTYPVDAFYLEDVCEGLGFNDLTTRDLLADPRKPGLMSNRRDSLLSWIIFCHVNLPSQQAFLVFLPGIALIAEVEEQLYELH